MKLKNYLNEEKWYDKVKKVDDKISALIDIFSSDKKIKDHRDFHALAEKLGIEPEELEEASYNLIQSFFSKGRYNEQGQGKTFNESELKIGDKIELEHTDNPIIARRIAQDHLTEFPGTGNNDGYYSRLLKMETEAKKDLEGGSDEEE